MSVKCEKCGTELPDNVAFCTECGAKIEKTAPAAGPAYDPQPAPRTVPQPAPVAQAKTTYSEEPVGFFPYFGLMALFTLPFVGFICSIIFSFAPKKKSLKNFARAQLVWTLIGAVLSILAFVLGITIFRSIADSVGSMTEGGMPEVEELLRNIMDKLPME